MAHKPSLLCVDDEVHILDSLERLLRGDFQVTRASSGAEGLKWLESHPQTAVILTDYQMPGLNGIEFLKEAKAIAPDTVRALLSGQVALSEIARAINLMHVHRLILKPWDNDYLKVQMLEAFKNHQLMKEKNSLERLAITDPITHLYNHRYLQDHLRIELGRATRHSRPLSVIMADLDHFKNYNDQYGHLAGDHLLAQVAKRLRKNVRDIDVVTRYGGEEFAIVMPDTDLSEARFVARRICEAMAAEPFAVGEVGAPPPSSFQARVTMSLGLASAPEHATQPAALLSCADRALYQAKGLGRNRVETYSLSSLR